MNQLKFFIGICFNLIAVFTFAQGLEGIVVEKYYSTDAMDEADANSEGAITPLPAGSTVYRVFVNMAPGYKFSQLFGTSSHNLTVSSTANFFNDPNYGVSINPGSVSVTNIRKHTAMIDSWFTTGGCASSKVGVLKVDDIDGTIGNQQNILANNAGGCFGLAVNGTNAQDGMLPSSLATYLVPNTLGLGGALDALNQSVGNSVVISNGSIAALGGIVGANESNMVLIGQFTTNGYLSFALNVQIVNIASGEAENYVAENPTSGELTHPSLTRTGPNVAPSISIASPLNNTTINVGITTISANATDANGAIAKVEFFVDGVSIGIDNVEPYSINYNASIGAHVINAVATDDDCVSTTSSNYNVNVIDNIAPSVSISSQSTAIVGDVVVISASAFDTDGSVVQVEFFVNDISIGIDNSVPYSMTFSAMLGSGQTLKAVATDNEGSTSISNIIVLNVSLNLPPAISLVTPLLNDIVIAPDVVNISAVAEDSDGSITQVEFFVNGVSIGIDLEAPYSFDWISSPGIKTFECSALDNNGAITVSGSVTLSIADSNGLPYSIIPVTQTCDISSYCMTLEASVLHPLDNVIGLDVTFMYNPLQFQPTGVINVLGELINPDYVETTLNILEPGILNVSLFFNGSAPALTEFQGSGNIFCVEFNRLEGLGGIDSTLVSVSSLQESYISGVQNESVTSGYAYSIIDYNYPSDLQYWYDGSPIGYNQNDPQSFPVTNIFGVTGSTVNSAETPVQPDISGHFVHYLGNGQAIFIERDMDNSSSIQAFVNAGDALVAKSLLLNEANVSVSSLIAMDVNLDGVVSAGDISQIKQRATLAIGEYQQAWNYDDTGASNGQPSKDWIFVDQSRLDNNSAFQISSTFPEDDFIGYSAARVPTVPFYIDANVSNYNEDGSTCPNIQSETYVGILLGDVNGSYVWPNQQSGDSLIFHLENAIYSSVGSDYYIEIPVTTQTAIEDVNAIDFGFQFNLNKLNYVETTTDYGNLDVYSYYNLTDHFLRNSSSTTSQYDYLSGDLITMKLKFSLNAPCVEVTSADFYSPNAMINGLVSTVVFVNPTPIPPIQILTPSPYCVGDEIAFTYPDGINGTTVLSYEWNFGNTDTGTLQNETSNYVSSGNFEIMLSATTVDGCTRTMTKDITINPDPQVAFLSSFNASTNEVSFVNTTSIESGVIAQYSWDFSDNIHSDLFEPTHQFANSGIYDVTLSAISDQGCSAVVTNSVNAVLGLHEINTNWNKLEIFPNPNNGFFMLRSTDRMRVYIIDEVGNRVSGEFVIGANQILSLNDLNLPNGIYLLCGYDGNKTLNQRFEVVH